MGPPFKNHIAPLLKPFVDKLITRFRRLARFTSTSQKDSSFLILNRHEVRRNLDVNDIAPVAVRRKVIHEQVVCVIHEEVKRVYHLPVVTYEWHLDRLLHNLAQCRFCLRLFLEQFNLHLLFTLFQEELGLSQHLFTFL